MLISQLRCVPVCFYCSISLCRCQYFVVLVCFRRQMVQRLHRCQIFRRYGRYGKFVVLRHPHNGLGPGQSTGVNFQQHKGGVLPDTGHLPVKIAAVCDVVLYIAASIDRAALAPHRQLVAQLFPKGAPLRGRVCNFHRAHRPLPSPLLQIGTVSLLPWYTKRSKIASPCGPAHGSGGGGY